MKKKGISLLLVLAMGTTLAAAGCGQSDPSDTDTVSVTEEAESADETEETQEEETESVAEISYANVYYDFAEQIAEEMEAITLVPEEESIAISVADENGATGVTLQASVDEENTTDYYLNAMVAGNTLTVSAEDGEIAAASSSISGDLEVVDNTVSFIPAAISADDPVDEIITVTMADGTVYQIHTVNELMPDMEITGTGVSEDNAGVYTFAVDKFLLRVNTDGELVYYRNLTCIGEQLIENFARQDTDEASYYTYFAELHEDYRNANGGYSSGMYVVMDENYVEIDYVTLSANDDENHTHGEGYLDQHEFVILGEDHYLLLSYTPELVDNLPDTVTGIDGGSTAYVWAGVFQEVLDGEVIQEINTTDYPLLYESAVEKIDYENSTDQGTTVTVNSEEVESLADGWMDYAHPNSLDYTLNEDGTVDKLLVSMRDQCAVYQFDFGTGAMEWILGGKASTLSGYDDYTSTRTDDNGEEFTALTYAQHYARYTNKNEDGTIDGNAIISVFDNQTGTAPFLTTSETPNLTRTFIAEIDTDAGTATVSDVINGTDLNELSEKYHIASHCGSVDYISETSVVIGWGLHGVIDNIGAYAPEGTISDEGYDDLRIGSRPIFTEYDMENGEITFELSVTRNANIENSEGCFSYRTYKTEE